MSDQPPVETPSATDGETDSNGQPRDETPVLGDAGKAAIDRMKAERDAARREARANADAAKRLQEIEDAQKSDAQRQADAAAKAQRELEAARSETARYKVATEHGISKEYLDLLGSGDEDVLTQRAEAIKPLLAAATERDALKAELEALKAGKPTPGSSRPTAALRPGATPQEVVPEDENSYPAHWLPQQAAH